MKTQNQYCDYCSKPLIKDNNKLAPFNGFCIEVGASTNGNGWGSRVDLITKQTTEICQECYNKVSDKIAEVAVLIDTLKKKK